MSSPTLSTPGLANHLPPEIWQRILDFVPRGSLYAMSLQSKAIYLEAVPLLYRTFEVSFAKCSKDYIDSLIGTMTRCNDLASLMKRVVIDLTLPCDTWQSHNGHQGMAAYPKTISNINGERNRWQQESLIVTSSAKLHKVIPHLKSLTSFQLVLAAHLRPGMAHLRVLGALAEHHAETLEELTLSEVALQENTVVLHSFRSLRALTLSTSVVEARRILDMLSITSNTLEVLRLRWLNSGMEQPIFSHNQEVRLKELKVLEMTGTVFLSVQGFLSLISESTKLEELDVTIKHGQLSIVWAKILETMAQDPVNFKSMKHLRFTSPKNSVVFWTSVSRFIRNCGTDLRTLRIFDSRAKLPGEFPQLLFHALRECLPRQTLDELIISWRSPGGLPYDLFSPNYLLHSVRTAHLTLPMPSDDDVEPGLRQMLLTFPKIGELYIVFIAHAGSAPSSMNEFQDLYERFLMIATQVVPSIARVGLCIYDLRPNQDQSFPVCFVESRGPDAKWRTLRYEDPSVGGAYPCDLYETPVFLAQRPAWQESMGNTFVQEKVICHYASELTGWPVDSRR